MPAEKRWIILTPDGGHVSIGRHTDPSEDEIRAVAQKLREAGTGGWLAVMEGAYYSRNRVTLLMVREIVPSGKIWDAVVASFDSRRRRSNAADSGPEPS